MAKPEWGTKRTCQTCGAKFYDMSRNPPTCPSCDAVWEAVAAKPSRRARPAAKPAKPEPKAKSAAADDDDVDGVDDMDTGSEADSDSDSDKKDDDVIEDPSELGEDEDDMAEVVVTQEKDDN